MLNVDLRIKVNATYHLNSVLCVSGVQRDQQVSETFFR